MRLFFTLLLLVLMPPTALAHEGGAIPADVWTHWNTDPLMLTALLLPLYLYLRGAATYPVARWRTLAFTGGLAVLFVGLISPLDVMGGTLFSGHMLQHLLFMLVAAPLLVSSRPLPSLLRGLPSAWRKTYGKLAHAPSVQKLWTKLARPVPVAGLHIIIVWVWHIPGLYSVALNQPIIHALQHFTFFATALLFWWMIFHTDHYVARILAVFAVMMTTGLLGALMTFATTSWYDDHGTYASAWGLTVLEDQQLAGLFMWIPPGVFYVLVAGVLLGGWLNTVEAKVRARERQLIKEMSDA